MVNLHESIVPGRVWNCDPWICTLQSDTYLQSDTLPTALCSQVNKWSVSMVDRTLFIIKSMPFHTFKLCKCICLNSCCTLEEVVLFLVLQNDYKNGTSNWKAKSVSRWACSTNPIVKQWRLSLCILADSPEPSLPTYITYGCRWRLRIKLRPLICQHVRLFEAFMHMRKYLLAQIF